MTNEGKTILVVGATGTVGGAAVEALLARGATVRALSRRGGAAIPGVEVVRGDLRDGATVDRALGGVSAAFYVSPHEPDEETLADGFVRACEKAGVRLVFVGVHVDGSTRVGRALRRAIYGRMLPHYRPKFRLSERVRRSHTNAVVLMPTNFFQNDELFAEDLRAGRFVQPFERPVNRVDVRDIGLAAARACLDLTLPAGAYPVVGPESLDGAACAAAWGTVLGHRVAYEGGGATAHAAWGRFEAAAARALEGKKRADFVATYALIRKLALPTRTEEVARTTALLGRPPTAYAAYVRETAARWGAEEGAISGVMARPNLSACPIR